MTMGVTVTVTATWAFCKVCFLKRFPPNELSINYDDLGKIEPKVVDTCEWCNVPLRNIVPVSDHVVGFPHLPCLQPGYLQL